MPTSAPGSSRCGGQRGTPAGRGFTLIELLIVLAIVVVSSGLIVLALRDSNQARLEEEGARLSALLEMARAEARVAGSTVRWVPRGGDADPAIQFRFVGLPLTQDMPTRWLDPGTRAQIVGATTLLLGPEAILPPQRVVLTLADRRLELASDGLGPFAVVAAAAAPP
jgi:general secretion pathway protein H